MKLFKRNAGDETSKKKLIAKGNLTDIEVDLISLLFDDMKPANGKGAVIKCENKDYICKGSSVKLKADDEGRVFVTVYEPEVKDSQGDFASAEEIKKACERFSQAGMVLKNDVNHDMQAINDCFVAENYILKTEDKEHFPDTTIGSWVQVLKFPDTQSPLWKKIKSGNFNGVSMYGKAVDDQSDFEKKISELEKMIEALKKNDDEAVNPAIATLEKQISELKEKAKSDTSERQIKELAKSIETLITSMTKAINTQIKGEETAKPDETVNFFGTKIVVKSDKTELYKSLANVDSGKKMNILSDNLGRQFIDTVLDFSPEIYSDITVGELNKSEKLDKGLIDDMIFRNKTDARISNKVGEFDIHVPTEILLGEMTLDQDTVEYYRDTMGDAAFGAYVEQKITNKIDKALKTIYFQGDRDSSDTRLKGMNGIIAQMKGTAEHHSVVKEKKFTYANLLTDFLETFSEDALAYIDDFVIYCSPKTLLYIQNEIRKRPTSLGDAFLIENKKVYFKGIEIKSRHMPKDTFIIGLSKFLILGYRTDATLKLEHSGLDWDWTWYVRVRFGAKYVPGGMIQLFEIAPPPKKDYWKVEGEYTENKAQAANAIWAVVSAPFKADLARYAEAFNVQKLPDGYNDMDEHTVFMWALCKHNENFSTLAALVTLYGFTVSDWIANGYLPVVTVDRPFAAEITS